MELIDATRMTDMNEYKIEDRITARRILVDYKLAFLGENPLTLVFSTDEHFINYGTAFLDEDSVTISSKAYFENENLRNEVVNICKYTTSPKFYINSGLIINKDVISAIANNPNIKNVVLTVKAADNYYTLTKEDYELFKSKGKETVEAHSYSPDLDGIVDPMLSEMYNVPVVGTYSRADLDEVEKYSLYRITEDDIRNFYLLDPNKDICFSDGDPNILVDAIIALQKLHYQGKIVINAKEKNSFSKALFAKINDLQLCDNIFVVVDIKTIPLNEYLKKEKKLYDMVSPAMDLSPFEKFLYAFNKVKTFKKYQAYKEDKSESRNLYKIIDNDYIVCAGFTNLLSDLLDKLDIPNMHKSVSVDVGFDHVPNDFKPLANDVDSHFDGHARLRVHIVDPKYGIDGYYVCDPTWDNFLKKDIYSHALMSNMEEASLDRYNHFDDVNNLSSKISSITLEEFFYVINKSLAEDIENEDEEKLATDIDRFFSEIYREFKNFDPEFINILNKKFGDLTEYNRKFTKEELTEIMTFIGQYLVYKGNRPLSGETLKQGITVLYRDVYKDSNYIETVEKVMSDTAKIQAKAFPKRDIERKDGTIEPFLNSENKFEESSLNL